MALVVNKSRVRKIDYLSFLAGLGTMLFIPTPFGRIAMFDFSSFFIGVFLFLKYYKTYNRLQIKIIILGIIWLFSANISNILADVDLRTSIKSSMIILSVPSMMVIGFFLFKRHPYSFLWYLVGYGISGVLSLYIFQNGALLYQALQQQTQSEEVGFVMDISDYIIDKVVYPLYFSAIIFSVIFPLTFYFRRIPYIIIPGIFAVGAVFLLSKGSRLNFLIYSISFIASFSFYFSKRITRFFIKNTWLSFSLLAIIVWSIFEIYSYAASNGKLGEAEQLKYETQIKESELGALGGRATVVSTVEYVITHPIIGVGNDEIDENGNHISAHSILFGAWAINGIGGLFFWTFVVMLIIKFINRGFLFIYPNWFPFLVFIYADIIWNIFFSPFGLFRGYVAMSIAFIIYLLGTFKKVSFNNKLR